MSTVLVTGGSGFIGSHAIVQLLTAGHTVRTTVRDPKREDDVRAMVRESGTDAGDPLSFFVANLESDAGWMQAVHGADYVLHVASPFPLGIPKHEDELVVPARDGALRVLRASRDAGVKRVVLTSSFAAVGYGHPPQTAPFDETTWTDPTGNVSAYVKSKTIAERTAWDFIAREGGALELSAVNPVGVFGPALGPQLSTSLVILQRMIDGALPAVPRLYLGAVDVRDVADLHLRAMTDPRANGERFLAVAGEFMTLVAVGKILRRHLGRAGKRVPRFQLPDFVVRIAALRDPTIRQILPELGTTKNATSEKAMRLLDWRPRSAEESIVSGADSLVRLNLVKTN